VSDAPDDTTETPRDARLLTHLYGVHLDDAEALLASRGWDDACACLDAMRPGALEEQGR
jgi:hypothetical protein